MYPIESCCPQPENSLLTRVILNGNNHSDQEWNRYENKLFESALAELDMNSPHLFEQLMAILPWKTLDQIKSHYEKLIVDVIMIETGEISFYENLYNIVSGVEHKRKGLPWTEEEHKSFLKGLDKCGKGEWMKISSYYVPSKTPSQVASHAQKYFRRLKCRTPLNKRRYSIHDIRLHNSNIVETAARQPNHHAFIGIIGQEQPANNLPSTIITSRSLHKDLYHYYGGASLPSNNATCNINNIRNMPMTTGNNIVGADQGVYEYLPPSYNWLSQASEVAPLYNLLSQTSDQVSSSYDWISQASIEVPFT